MRVGRGASAARRVNSTHSSSTRDFRAAQDRGRVVNARFAAMAAHYLFEPDFCNVASGWEKGVQDTRRRIWQGGRRRTRICPA
jgi:hypothetical protein